jgi:hypothetical protein
MRRPPLPGAFSPGNAVYYTGATEDYPLDDQLVYGTQGEVVGPGKSDERVSVLFAGIEGAVSCYATQVSSPCTASTSLLRALALRRAS